MYSSRHRQLGVLRRSVYVSIGAGMLLYEASMDMLQDMVDTAKIAQHRYRHPYHDHRENYATKDDIRELKRELEVISQKLSEESVKRHAPEL